MHLPKFWILVFAALLVFITGLALEAAAVPFNPPVDGDWIPAGTTDFTDRTGYCEGNIIVPSHSVFTIENSVITVNVSVIVQPHGSIILKNATIEFDCSMAYDNRFDVLDNAACTILDGDDDTSTTDDMSVVTSTNDIPFNFTIVENATFEMKNSMVSKCGRPFSDPFLDEGLAIRTDDWMIMDSIIKDGYYGLIIDSCENGRVENTTIEGCYIGLYMVGTRDTMVINTKVNNNTGIGVQVRGFHGNMVLDSLTMEGNVDANLQMQFISGFNIEVVNCDIGPLGAVGMDLEDVKDITFRQNRVTGCTIGVRISDGDLDMALQEVSDCAQGVLVADGAAVRFLDLDLTDTTITVDPGTETNISMDQSMTWTRVTGDLSCDLAALTGMTINIESSVLEFRSSTSGPTGLWVTLGGTLNVANSTVGSPSTHDLVCHIGSGGRTRLVNSDFSHLGASTSVVHRMGMFVAGSGTIEEVTLNGSLVGLVLGGAQTNIVNLTVRDCLTGIMADGDLGRSGVVIRGLDLEGCDVAIRAINDGSVSVQDGRFSLSGEGFNITHSTVIIKDSRISDPGTGHNTAVLRTTSQLDLVNCVSSRDFDIGPTENTVSIYWYLNLTMRYLSDGSPLSDARVTAREASGAIDIRDKQGGADGKIEKLELRELMYIPAMTVTTPHTITVTKGALKDSFTLTMDGSKDHVFYMDNYPPVLLVNSPEDGSLHNVSTVTFEGEAWDAVVTETEGLATMRYRVDDGEWMAIGLPVANVWSFDAELEDGFHVVEIQVHDRIGNLNSTTRTVEVDTVPPLLTILSPDDGILINVISLLVRGHTETGNTVTVDGTAVTVDENGFFNITVDLSEGRNLITIVATDAKGATITVTREVTVDTVVPQVTLDQDDFATNQVTFLLSGDKKANATIYVNGFLAEYFTSSRFETVIALETEGLNAVDIWSEDLAGNNWSTSIIIIRDTTPPDLVVGSLPLFTNQATITVQGSTDDPDAIITVNGQEVTLAGLAFAHVVTLSEGDNTITVEAVDQLGNAAEPNVQVVTLSTVPPSLTITTPRKIETLEDEHELEGETDPGLPVSVRVVLGAYTKVYNVVSEDDGTFTIMVALPQVGNHSVTVTVTNEAGNQASEEVFFVRNRQDVKPPPKPSEPSWLDENWSYLILVAAIIGAMAIWMFTLSANKRRRASMERERAARRASAEAASQEPEGEDWEDGPEDEGTDEPEDGDEEGPEDGDEEGPEDGDEEGPEEDEEGPEEDEWAETEEEKEGSD